MEPRWLPTTHFRYDYYSLSSVFESYMQEMPKVVGFPFNYGYENLDILYDENNFDRQEGYLRENPEKIQEQIIFLKSASQKLLHAAKQYGSHEGPEAVSAWHKVFLEYLPALGIVVAVERVLVSQLKKFLDESDFLAVSFADETKTAFEMKSFLNIAGKGLSGDELESAVDGHIQEYGWLGNKIMSYQPFTHSNIKARLAEISPADAKSKLIEIDKNRILQQEGLNRVLAECTEAQQKLVLLYRDLLFWRTTRAEAVSLACTWTAPLFAWVGKRLGLNREQLARFSGKEILDMLRTGAVKDYSVREKFYGYLVDGKVSITWGSDGRGHENQSEVAEFSGVVANRGKISGRVKVVHELHDIHKVEKGDILVTPASNPNMIAAMEKAAAFITDSGSLTSHAAIVSRELGVPCIVATKIATRVLKDGDIVEVDAEKGIVKIVK